ncbi:galactose-binding domain-containing protein [Aquimarina agarilytica]|uniref:galactose-binding domain-containing protein n=1 Tax=Aquimarina agarilytica TaxID=1087449 RepID=UPI0002898835|nr:Ig-like domain-containing protein [Aquimarina agarilytica]
MKKLGLLSLFTFLTITTNAQRDWDNVPIPPDPGPGRTWVLQEAPSDDFNYTFNGSSNRVNFGPSGQPAKWYNQYHDQPNGRPNVFPGPGPTIWTRDHISVGGGTLNIIASRVPGESKIDLNGVQTYNFSSRSGCMTNLNRVIYPVYVEARVQIMNSMLASDVWLLSPDDTEEIDIIEAYGGAGDDGRNQFFAERIHLSHHVFIRQPFRDYQPRDINSFWRRRAVNQWGGRTVNIGVYWVSPTRLEYYIDGQLQRIVDNNAVTSRLIDEQFQATYPAGVTSTGRTGELFFDPNLPGFQQMNVASSLEEAQQLSNISVIDPFNHLQNGRRFSKEMDIIINVEDQSFQADAGRSPSDAEINRPEDNVMRVDWIRVYKPVAVNGPQNAPVNTDRERSLVFTNRNLFAPSGAIDPEFEAGEEVSLSFDYATGSENGNEEAINYIAVLVREIDENGDEVASSPFTAVIDVDRTPDLANQGIANFAYTIPSTFDEAGNNPIPSSDELEDGHQLLLVLFMSVDNDAAFADATTTITYSNDINTNIPIISPAPVIIDTNPDVSFSNPSNNANFSVGDNLGVTVNASDSDGNIANVRLFFDGNLVRQENISPYNWGTDNSNNADNSIRSLSAGSHILEAIATDNNGNSITESITINVITPTPIPNPTPAPVPAPVSNPGGATVRTNIALNKIATQSSTLFDLNASFAVDGDRNNFNHTDEDANAWLEIDLGDRFNINQVTIWNRLDCCADRLREYQLFISDQAFSSTDIVTTANQPGVGVFFQSDMALRPTSVGLNRIGRYVRVQLIGTGILHIAEIEVFGSPVTSGAKKLTPNIVDDSNKGLIIYPNPVSRGNAISIENTRIGNTFSIIDFSGKLIKVIKSTEGQTLVDTTNLATGIYFIQLDRHVFKLVIN